MEARRADPTADDNICDEIEAALWESEERYRAFFELTAVGATHADPYTGRLIRVNDAYCRITGYSRAELLRMSISDITHPEDREADNAKFQALARGDIPVYESEKRYIRGDGESVWVIANVTMLRDEAGRPLHTIGLVQDISRRKRAEEETRKSEERYRSFVVNSTEGIWRIESKQPIDTSLALNEQIQLIYKNAYLAECNDAMARMYGHDKAEEILGERISNLMLIGDPVNIASAKAFIRNRYRLRNAESVEVDKDGGKKYFMSNLIGIVENGFLIGAWGIQQDITEIKMADEQLRHSRQQMRSLAARLQSLREKERTEIAREIHDVLGQELTGLKIDIAWIKKRLPDADDEKVRAKMEERLRATIELLDDTLATVKNLSASLRPRVLDTFGLSAAIEWQCQEFQRRTGIVCDCRLPDYEIPLSPERSTALFRVFQETLTNVARHSQATRVDVELKVDEMKVMLSVRDNGTGMTDEEIAAPTSLGLLGMRERVAQFGGDIKVKGNPGEGANVIACIPLGESLGTGGSY
jgi:PAS domain S-box-containing protein